MQIPKNKIIKGNHSSLKAIINRWPFQKKSQEKKSTENDKKRLNIGGQNGHNGKIFEIVQSGHAFFPKIEKVSKKTGQSKKPKSQNRNYILCFAFPKV